MLSCTGFAWVLQGSMCVLWGFGKWFDTFGVPSGTLSWQEKLRKTSGYTNKALKAKIGSSFTLLASGFRVERLRSWGFRVWGSVIQGFGKQGPPAGSFVFDTGLARSLAVWGSPGSRVRLRVQGLLTLTLGSGIQV